MPESSSVTALLFSADGKFSRDAAAQGNGSDLLNLGDLSSCLKSMMKGTGGKCSAKKHPKLKLITFISTLFFFLSLSYRDRAEHVR